MHYVVSRPRVGVFIDTQNLYHSARDLLERTVNFETILREAVAGRELVHAISYTVEREGEAYLFEYHEGPAPDGHLRLDLLYSGLSAGTELTILKGSNPYLHARWDEEGGLFVPGEPSAST